MKHKLKNQTKLKNRRILSLVLALALCLSVFTGQLLLDDFSEGTAIAASTTASSLKAPSIQVAASGYEGLKIT